VTRNFAQRADGSVPADRIVVTSATAKTYPHGIVRLEGQIAAIDAAILAFIR